METDTFSLLSSFADFNFDLTVILVVATLILMSVNLWRLIWRPRNLPPGPYGVPLLGVIPFMGRKSYVTIQKWWRRYGDIYSMYMGSRLVVVLNGVDVMRECLVKQGDRFSGRPWNYFKKITKNTGIVFTDGHVWREHRWFTSTCLRYFGMGKSDLECRIQEEAGYLLREIDSLNQQPFRPDNLVLQAVSNIICGVIYGSRFEYSDAVFQGNLQALQQSAKRHSFLKVINFFPLLEFLPNILPQDKLLSQHIQQREDYAQEQMQRHMDTLDIENPRDFIDAYLTRMFEFKKKEDSTTFEERQLKRTIQDLFISGTETVSATMRWALYFMVRNPDIQAKVQDEIDRVIGRSRFPNMHDKRSMPYTEATIMECQRLGNISLLSIPRCTLEDTTVHGYDIPKGTWVFVNRWGTHASGRYWRKPSLFDPTRFLDDQGRVKKPEAFIAYGMGPRSCIGDTFAKMELFIFFTSVLQAFQLRLPEGAPDLGLEPSPGIIYSPQPFSLLATHR